MDLNMIGKKLKKFKWSRIATAVLAIVTGILFLAVPDDSARVICAVSGILLVALGCISIAMFLIYGFGFSGRLLITGAALILFGVFCLVNPAVLMGILTVIFGLFIAVDGCASLSDSICCARAHAAGWFPMLLLSVLTIILGGIVMFGTFETVMIFAGISLLIDGVCDLIMILVFSRRIREAKEKLNKSPKNIYYMD